MHHTEPEVLRLYAGRSHAVDGTDKCRILDGHLQDLGTSLLGGDTQRYLPVKTPCPPQRRVQSVRPICCACTHSV